MYSLANSATNLDIEIMMIMTYKYDDMSQWQHGLKIGPFAIIY